MRLEASLLMKDAKHSNVQISIYWVCKYVALEVCQSELREDLDWLGLYPRLLCANLTI